MCDAPQEQRLLPLLMGLEMPMVHVLAAMEHSGVAFSPKVCVGAEARSSSALIFCSLPRTHVLCRAWPGSLQA